MEIVRFAVVALFKKQQSRKIETLNTMNEQQAEELFDELKQIEYNTRVAAREAKRTCFWARFVGVFFMVSLIIAVTSAILSEM